MREIYRLIEAAMSVAGEWCEAGWLLIRDGVDFVHRFILAFTVIVVFVSVILNWFIGRQLNFVLVILAMVLFALILRRASVLVAFKIVDTVKNLELLATWLKATNAYMFYMVLYLVVLGQFNFSEAHWTLIALMAAFSGLYFWKKNFEAGSRYLKFFSGLVLVLIIIINIIASFPQAWSEKHIGCWPARAMGVSATEKKLATVRGKMDEVKQLEDKNVLDEIDKKLDALIDNPAIIDSLKIKEMSSIIQAIEKKSEYRSSPKKVKEAASKVLSSLPFSSKSSPKVSKQWEPVLERTLVGKGYVDDGAVLIAKFGTEIKPGYKVSLVSENGEKFDVVWNGKWVTKNGAFEFTSECQEEGGFSMAAKEGLKVALKIQKPV